MTNILRTIFLWGALALPAISLAQGAGTPVMPLFDLPAVYRNAAAALPNLETGDLIMPRGDIAEDSEVLEGLLRDVEAWDDLEAGRKAGILVALADRKALDGDRTMARQLYGILQETDAEILRRWGVYMVAGIDFAEGAYQAAAIGYESVCGWGSPAEWRQHACSMTDLASRLHELDKTGGEHDDHVAVTP